MSDTIPGSDGNSSAIHVVAAVIVVDHRVLIAQRPDGSSHPLLWELPGGKLEPNESAAEALARELSEELGIRARIGAFLGESVHRYPGETVRLQAYWVRRFEGRPQAFHHRQLRWVAPDQLDEYRFTEADVPLVHELMRALSGT